jgi:hypothetical protein
VPVRTPIVTAHAAALVIALLAGAGPATAADPLAVLADLPALTAADRARPERDWLVAPPAARARACRDGDELVLTNGLVLRAWRLGPNGATVALDDLMTGASLLRGVKPEAIVLVDGREHAVGGLVGQPNLAYLTDAWKRELRRDPAALRLVGLEVGETVAPFAWKRVRHAEDRPWPPPGVAVRFDYRAEEGIGLDGVTVSVHYEMYDAIPLLAKWITVTNGPEPIRLETFTSELLAMVEAESSVDEKPRWTLPNVHVESDYAFGSMHPGSSNQTVAWEPDPEYATQVNYRRTQPSLLVSRPPIGPDLVLAPGETFTSFRTFLLVHDSTERERRGLAVRRMYRTIAPWVTENPILMHVRSADPDAVRLAVDQCADVGFEMVIMTFGSGFDIENDDPAYVASIRALVDYAHERGVELGGYSLLASRHIDDANDAINPDTGKPGGMTFGHSPCLGSPWGRRYFEKLRRFIEATGLDLLEHDGSYPGDVCASTTHPGHRGELDSQWTQWRTISDFYRWCRGRGTSLNVPDFYVLSGTTKVGMGYRETNWSLPRAQQVIHARQNIFDGTWEKTPSMGWMFVPLVEYHGGGPAATLEPLSEHRAEYDAHLANNFGAGVQACYRGPRLYDTPETRAVVKRWVDFYRRHRAILDSDVIHVRRADGRDVDCLLHVNPNLPTRGLAMVYNPLDRPVERDLVLPLYYTGLTGQARIRERDGEPRRYALDRAYRVQVPVRIGAGGVTWLVIE